MHSHKKGFFIKSILAIGDEHGKNGEHLQGPIAYLDNHPVILNVPAKSKKKVITRIVKQIKWFGDIAAKNHNEGRLTELITDEFSFYTQARPLTLADYRNIINNSAYVLKDLPPNIVLVISSMAVLWSDGTVRNVVLQIQSPNKKGELPIIHHFSKETFSRIDPYYARLQSDPKYNPSIHDCYEFRGDDYASEHSPDVVLKGTRAVCHSKNQYKSAIIVYGLHIPPIIYAHDICRDHQIQVALNNVKMLLQKIDKDEVPFHITHSISSNSTSYDAKALCASPVQADYDNIQAGDVTVKKSETYLSYFGSKFTLHIYHQRRAEILKEDEFTIAMQKKLMIAGGTISSLKDNEKNTLLHQIFLPNKTSVASPHQFRQLKNFKKILPHFDSVTINQQNKDGDTPLHLALKLANSKIAIKLVEQGARLDIKNENGISPIEWLYQNQNDFGIDISLITNLLVNNINVYRAHQARILTLIDDIKEKAIKKKVAASALCFEISTLTPEKTDEAKAIELLKIADTSSDRLFIQHNIGKLLSTFKSGLLYHYLIEHDAIENNKGLIAHLPKALHAHLLSQTLSRKKVNEEDIDLFKKGLTQLYYHLPIGDRLLIRNTILNVASSILDEAINAETVSDQLQPQVLAQKNIVNTILSNLTAICDDSTIKNKIINDFIEQCIYLDIFKSLLKNPKFTRVEKKNLKFLWSQLADIDFYETEENLSLAEQMMLYALNAEDADFLDKLILRRRELISFAVIDKITDKQANKYVAQKWFYQQLLINELKRNLPNKEIIFFTLSYYPFLDLNQPISQVLNVVDAIVLKAWEVNSPPLVDRILKILPLSQNEVNVMLHRIVDKFSCLPMFKQWLYQTLLENEVLGETHNANILRLSSILSVPLELNYLKIADDGLTIGEKLFDIAYSPCDSSFLDKVKCKLPHLCHPDVIEKIANTYLVKENSVKKWFYRELVRNELKRGHDADQNVLLTLMPYCDLSKPSGLKLFLLGEQCLAQAFIMKSSELLDKLTQCSPSFTHEPSISKVTNAFPNKSEMQQWVYQTLINNEFHRKPKLNWDKIFLTLRTSPITVLDCESDMCTFTIGERLFVYAYYSRNRQLFIDISACFSQTALNVKAVLDKLANNPHFPLAGIKWLQQQAKHTITHHDIWKSKRSDLIPSFLSIMSHKNNKTKEKHEIEEKRIRKIHP